MRSGPAIVLTGKGYKEHHWLVVPHQPIWLSPLITYFLMPSSSCTIPGTVNHLGIGHAAVRVRGQAGSHTNTGRAITPFMFNEEEYRVGSLYSHRSSCFDHLHSMLATRMESSTPQLMISTVTPTLMTQIKTGLKIYIVGILSTPSVGWRVAS